MMLNSLPFYGLRRRLFSNRTRRTVTWTVPAGPGIIISECGLRFGNAANELRLQFP